MAQKYLNGFADLGYFKILTDDTSLYATDTVSGRKSMTGARSCNKTDNKQTANIPADDNPAWDTLSDWQATTLTIVMRFVTIEQLAFLSGATMNTSNTGFEEGTYDAAPFVALNFRAAIAAGGFRLFRYYRAKLTSAEVNHQTKGESTDPQDYTLTFECSARAVDNKVRGVEEVADLAAANLWLATIPQQSAA